MRDPARRTVSVLLLGTFLLEATGCTSLRRAPVAEVPAPAHAHIVGVTTVDGRELSFAGEARIERDTVFATWRDRPFRLPVDSVQRWLLRRTDAGKTTLLVLGVTAGVLAVAGAIYAATKESCPFVYSWDGKRYVFDAEPYGGAVTRGLERADYSRLEHLQRDGEWYRLLVTNEVNETQMTNLMELWMVDHRTGLQILPDEWGGLHTLTGLIPPASAVDQTGRDLRQWLTANDNLIWEPVPVPDSSGSLRDEIVLTFPKPLPARRAKLVTRVATGLWGSHMIRPMLELRGREVTSWYAAVDASPARADSVRRWSLREELYALQVDVEEPTGWQTRGILPGSGPFLAEDRVIPLDIGRVQGDSLRLRIRPPRGFWALNSFAVDYSPDEPLVVDTLHPVAARDSRQGDVLAAITAADSAYYAMPTTGDYGYVSFRAPVQPAGMVRTVVLHTRGYYHLHLPAAGEPDTVLVSRLFAVPGAAADFAAARYRQWPLARRAPH